MYRTVVHLHPSQIWHRLRYTLRRRGWEKNSKAVNDRYERRAADLPAHRWDHPGLARVAAFRASQTTAAKAQRVAEDALRGRFRFLNRSADLGVEVEWFRPELDTGTRLWKTLLHEFSFAEDLAQSAASDERFRARMFELARNWRATAPIGCPGFARDAWNARAAATRLMHWAVAGSHLGLRADDPDAVWLGRQIGLHGLFVRDNLELDLLGNHLFRDAIALVFADTLVGGVPDALSLLETQLAEQILPDGAHIERAPMYHAICLRDLLEVHLLLGDDAPSWLRDALARMCGFLESIQLGDGEIPLLGDGWLGEVDTPTLIAACRDRVSPIAPSGDDSASGLVAISAGDWRAVLRAGPHGPDYLLGHAHSDLLSFDLSFGTARIVTDTGTSLYDPGAKRDALRSTAAHNTIALDGVEQLEAWGSFRAGRRGRAQLLGRGSIGNFRWVAASHDAFRWRPGRPMHERLLVIGEAGGVVLDRVIGNAAAPLSSHLHRHPDGHGVPIRALTGPAREEATTLQDRFGEERPMTRLRIDAAGDLPWVGGWLFGSLAEAETATLQRTPDTVHLTLAGDLLDLHWRPAAAAGNAVELTFAPAPGGC